MVSAAASSGPSDTKKKVRKVKIGPPSSAAKPAKSSDTSAGRPRDGDRLYRYKVDWTHGVEIGEIYAATPGDLYKRLLKYLGYDFPRHSFTYTEVSSPPSVTEISQIAWGVPTPEVPPQSKQSPNVQEVTALARTPGGDAIMIVPASQPPKRGYGLLALVGLVGIAVGIGVGTALAIGGAGALVIAAVGYVADRKQRTELELARERRREAEVDIANRILTEHIRGTLPDEVIALAKDKPNE